MWKQSSTIWIQTVISLAQKVCFTALLLKERIADLLLYKLFKTVYNKCPWKLASVQLVNLCFLHRMFIDFSISLTVSCPSLHLRQPLPIDYGVLSYNIPSQYFLSQPSSHNLKLNTSGTKGNAWSSPCVLSLTQVKFLVDFRDESMFSWFHN